MGECIMNDDLQFLTIEYQSLRHEIEAVGKELRDTERYTVIIVGTVWVWLATQCNSVPPALIAFAWWLPVFVVVLGIVRFLGIQQTLGKIAAYIATSIEPRFLQAGAGWENHLKSKDMSGKVRWWISSLLIWVALLAASLTVALSPRVKECPVFH